MEAAGCTPAEVGKEPGAAPASNPLQPLVPAHERGAVSRVDAGQLCTLAGPAVAVGGGGGSVQFSCALLVQTAVAALRPMGSFLCWLVFRRGFRTQFPPLGFCAMASGFLMAPVRGWGRGGGGGGQGGLRRRMNTQVLCSVLVLRLLQTLVEPRFNFCLHLLS